MSLEDLLNHVDPKESPKFTQTREFRFILVWGTIALVLNMIPIFATTGTIWGFIGVLILILDIVAVLLILIALSIVIWGILAEWIGKGK